MEILEADLISKLRNGVSAFGPRNGMVLGIGDDAALFAPRRGYETILTCDWFLEGTHFLRNTHPADAVGWKCLARAVSDVAAMGGEPRCVLLSLALPESLTGRWLDKFLGGLRRAAGKFKCPLAGGDTTRRRELCINVTAVGEVRFGQAVQRSGARAGDLIFVSGRLGEAELGLRLLRRAGRVNKRVNKKDTALKKHLYPEPRIALGQWLAKHQVASAMMDLSDGLSTDLHRLCAASGVGARIAAARIPAVRAKVQRGTKPFDILDLALNGGDDYELLFTVRPGKARSLTRTLYGVPLTVIGEITRERDLSLFGFDGREKLLQARGWDPFRK
jgi:thiamine-monophosphate kinase